MLILKNIVKDYITGDTTVRALKGIDINFRESEFVAVLGHNGSGKSTQLDLLFENLKKQNKDCFEWSHSQK
mgnify:CR=1 FL=1